MTGSISIPTLLCVLIIQVTIETIAMKTEHLDDCHDNDIILNCPPFAKVKSRVEKVEMTWQFKVTTTKRWRTVAKIVNGKTEKTANNTHLVNRLTIHRNGSLGIRSLKDEDERLYRCKVTKSAGGREIHMVELNLTCTGLTVTKRQVCTEKDVVLNCKPTHKIDPINHGPVTWHKKNTHKNKLSWSAISNTNASKEGQKLHGNGSLWLRGGRTEGEKVYRCVVAKSLKGSREMHLTVVRDVICRREKRQTGLHQVSVCIGDAVKLPCTILEHVNNSQVRSIKWRVRRSASPKHFQQLAHSRPKVIHNQTIFINGGLTTHNVTRLHDSKVDSVSLEPNGSLFIKNVRGVDEGDFECIVKTRHHQEARKQTIHVKPVDCNKKREKNETVNHVKPTNLATQASNNNTTKVVMTTEPPMTTSGPVKNNGSLGRNDSNHVTNQDSDVDGHNHSTPFSAPPKTVSQLSNPTTRKHTQTPTTSSTENIADKVFVHPTIETRTWTVVKHSAGISSVQTTIVTTSITTLATQKKETGHEEVTSKQIESPNDVSPTGSKANCGGNLTAATGGFQSPNFPSAYPANSYCKWTISVPQDYAAIDLTLEQMNMEHDDNCQNDYVAIYDELDNQVGSRRCGVSDSSPIKVKVRGNLAMVEFKSDHSVQKPGFKLTYRGVETSGK